MRFNQAPRTFFPQTVLKNNIEAEDGVVRTMKDRTMNRKSIVLTQIVLTKIVLTTMRFDDNTFFNQERCAFLCDSRRSRLPSGIFS